MPEAATPSSSSRALAADEDQARGVSSLRLLHSGALRKPERKPSGNATRPSSGRRSRAGRGASGRLMRPSLQVVACAAAWCGELPKADRRRRRTEFLARARRTRAPARPGRAAAWSPGQVRRRRAGATQGREAALVGPAVPLYSSRVLERLDLDVAGDLVAHDRRQADAVEAGRAQQSDGGSPRSRSGAGGSSPAAAGRLCGLRQLLR